jgi:dTDP-glucose pyrophosphorylase
MKAVTLAGGPGTRISEETHPEPERITEIGGKPILRLAVMPLSEDDASHPMMTADVGAGG